MYIYEHAFTFVKETVNFNLLHTANFLLKLVIDLFICHVEEYWY